MSEPSAPPSVDPDAVELPFDGYVYRIASPSTLGYSMLMEHRIGALSWFLELFDTIDLPRIHGSKKVVDLATLTAMLDVCLYEWSSLYGLSRSDSEWDALRRGLRIAQLEHKLGMGDGGMS